MKACRFASFWHACALSKPDWSHNARFVCVVSLQLRRKVVTSARHKQSEELDMSNKAPSRIERIGCGAPLVTGYNRALIGGCPDRPTLVMYQESPRPSGTVVTACAETHHIAIYRWNVLVACVKLIIPPFPCPKRLGNVMHLLSCNHLHARTWYQTTLRLRSADQMCLCKE